jgi:predicted nucleotidyltransferase
VKFASCEDVIIHKMVAARAIDIEDVKNMLIKNKDSLDFKYVNKWLTKFDKTDEHKGILERFNDLLSQ